MCKLGKFWQRHKDTIKNIIIGVSVPVAIIAIYGIRSLNQTITANGLDDIFYGDDEEFNKELEELMKLEGEIKVGA